MKALIGYSGFVGKNLLSSGSYSMLFNSKNSDEMRGRHFSQVVCAGVNATKWMANKNPEEDRRQIVSLIRNLESITSDKFILISTVDVYQAPILVDEKSIPEITGQAYGVNRFYLEEKVKELFPKCTIVRLPGLYGAGLKKNAIFDLYNDNMVECINPTSVFQWYDVRRLHSDLNEITKLELDLINITSEPLPMRAIGDRFFPGKLQSSIAGPAVRYDVRTVYASTLGGEGSYHFSSEQVLNGIGDLIRGGL